MASFFVPNAAQIVRTAFVSCTRAPRVQVAPRTFQLLSRGYDKRYATSNRRLSTLSAQTQNESSDLSDVSGSAKSSLNSDGPETQHGGTKNDSIREEDDPQTLKAWMRAVPHPVAVITARKDLSTADATACVGATVSSFNTVTFSPEPIISFNLHKDSTTLKAISSTRYFSITLLRNNSKGAELANIFTRGNDPSPFVASITEADHPLQFSNWKVDGLPELLPPKVRLTGTANGEDDASAFAIFCELRKVIEVGDHVIVVGRSLKTNAATLQPQKPGRTLVKQPVSYDDICLSYAHGSYSGTGLRSRRRKVWLDQDLFRDIPIDTLQYPGLDELEHHYADITSKIEAGINGRNPGTLRRESRWTYNFGLDELKQALQYYRSRYDAVTQRKQELDRQIRPTGFDPPLNHIEENELKRKSSFREKELREERTIYQQKLSHLMEMQRLQQEDLEAESLKHLNNDLDAKEVQMQIQRLKRKFQILQEAIAAKVRLKSTHNAIDDLIPHAKRDEDFLGKLSPQSLHAIRNQLEQELDELYRTIQHRPDHQGAPLKAQDSEKSAAVERSQINMARRARILQTAITLKVIASSAGGAQARDYLKAMGLKYSKPVNRKVVVDPEQESNDNQETMERRETQEEMEEEHKH